MELNGEVDRAGLPVSVEGSDVEEQLPGLEGKQEGAGHPNLLNIYRKFIGRIYGLTVIYVELD